MTSKVINFPPRSIRIDISLEPSISGYGGWDEWTLENKSTEEREKFFDELNALVEKHGGFYSGVE